ncbi:FAD-binding oxidoreductase [Dinoroseobacter sp. S375]|uniref:NAD(P)/FAD-dependent oxidoreductase n=1 Tax=Dinoroseobacter sp. S375 TaxID=3415136 RepID=UPI003C7D940B
MNLLDVNDSPGTYPPSYYAETTPPLAPFPGAQGHLHTDVCVVGGGYTGLSAALHLARRGYDVLVLEAQRFGFGASGRNGGQVGSGQRLEQEVLEARYGAEPARFLWDSAQEARALVDSLVAEGIDCDLTPGVIYATERSGDIGPAQDSAAHLADRYGYVTTPLDRSEVQALTGSPAYCGGVLDPGAAHLNPFKLVLGLARQAQNAGAQLCEGSRVTGIADDGPHVQIATAEANITAEHVVLAGNGYLGELDPRTAAHVMPINSYMIATAPLGDLADEILPQRHAVADSRFVVNYFRLSPDRRLLFGGGESYSYRFPKDIAAKVRRPLAQIFPQLAQVEIDYAWGGTLGITRSRLPYATRPSPRVLSAGGYSGHGVALSIWLGRAMAQAIDGDDRRFARFAELPVRAFPGGPALRGPLLFGAMSAAALSDRLPL